MILTFFLLAPDTYMRFMSYFDSTIHTVPPEDLMGTATMYTEGAPDLFYQPVRQSMALPIDD